MARGFFFSPSQVYCTGVMDYLFPLKCKFFRRVVVTWNNVVELRIACELSAGSSKWK